MTVTINQPVPNFAFVATNNTEHQLSDFQGKHIVLYFYPKDATPGCTQESIDFAAWHQEFAANQAVIWGISRDSLKSHENFKAKHCFPFELICDTEENLCQLFDVLKEKNRYGRKVIGIERSTFVINDQGILVKAWRNVKVPGHVEEVLAYVKSLAPQQAS